VIFLHGDLTEEIYMEKLLGFEKLECSVSTEEDLVWFEIGP
jgi:hypothetical protein